MSYDWETYIISKDSHAQLERLTGMFNELLKTTQALAAEVTELRRELAPKKLDKQQGGFPLE